MENWTIQLGTRWTLHLDSVGGEHGEFDYLFLPLVYITTSNITTILVEFALANTLRIQPSCSPPRLFCPLLICEENWMKIIGKLSPRGNINSPGYGKFH
jgi:hypothetical protein